MNKWAMVMVITAAATGVARAEISGLLQSQLAQAAATRAPGSQAVGAPIGGFLGGALGTLIGIRPTLWVAALGGAASFVWLLSSPIPFPRMTVRASLFSSSASSTATPATEWRSIATGPLCLWPSGTWTSSGDRSARPSTSELLRCEGRGGGQGRAAALHIRVFRCQGAIPHGSIDRREEALRRPRRSRRLRRASAMTQRTPRSRLALCQRCA